MAVKTRGTTNSELAVLNLLAEQPMHGYQIEQTIEARGMREWTEIGFSSIYYILEKLRARGSVESRLEPAVGKGPARQVFSLTPTGQEEFQKTALNALASPSRAFSSFQLGLASLPMLEKAKILNALRSYQMLLRNKHEELKVKSAGFGPNLPWHATALFDLDLAQLRCEMDWLDNFISTVENQL
ncbi:MAG: PadR family transcriptional regulator [Anaerolineaceae bacterium]|nr:PadR family transcriptional regulator [Anaerolineaceae bacterium]